VTDEGVIDLLPQLSMNLKNLKELVLYFSW